MNPARPPRTHTTSLRPFRPASQPVGTAGPMEGEKEGAEGDMDGGVLVGVPPSPSQRYRRHCGLGSVLRLSVGMLASLMQLQALCHPSIKRTGSKVLPKAPIQEGTLSREAACIEGFSTMCTQASRAQPAVRASKLESLP